MKLKTSFFCKILVPLVIISIISEQGCKKKEEPAPEIPPSSTFLMDMTFKDQDTTNKDIATYQSWGYSAINVGVWNFIITLTFAVPVASFVESFNHEAEYHRKDEYWTWAYSFNAGGIQHQAELKGFYETDSIIWEMRIDEFLWYQGKSHTSQSGGYWILNESKTQQTPLLKITWAKNSDGSSFIKYTNVAASSSVHYKNHGEYIMYGTESNGEYDRFYDILLIDDIITTISNLTEIEWNFANRYGRVKDPKHFNDSEWHCWDHSLNDVACQ